MRVYFFGCWNGRLGHYLFDSARQSYRHDRLLPWPRIDGVLAPDGEASDLYRRTEAQGVARLHHRDDWTALAWWDRSVDTRGGSNAAIFAQGTHTVEAMLKFGREHFPSIMARFAYEIRV